MRGFKDGCVSMDIAQNILSDQNCFRRMAMAVATIDAMNWNEVVGCIAGDDDYVCNTDDR